VTPEPLPREEHKALTARAPSSQTPPYERWFLIGSLIAYLALSLGFSLGPIFEGWDEPGHYRYATEIIRQKGLPDPFTPPAGEFQQAPLYYFLMVPAVALVGAPDIAAREARHNPYQGFAWNIASSDNKNLFIHLPDEVFPFTNDPVARAFHLLRLTSIALNSLTVWLAYHIFRRLWPDRPDRRLAALGLVAFTPVFVSLSGLLNNDNLAIFLATLCLYLLLIKPRQGFRWWWAVTLGLTLGAGLLTKTNLIFLGVPVGFVLLTDRRSWAAIPAIGAIVVAVAGWYYARNALVYGDVTGIVIFERMFPGWITPRDQITLPLVLGRWLYLYQTYWAHFGYNIIEVGPPIEAFFTAISLTTVVTLPLLALRTWRRARAGLLDPDRRRRIWLMSLFGLAMVALVLDGSLQPYSLAQGRYVLPIITATAAGIVLSLETWLPARVRKAALLSLPPVMVALCALCLFGYYLPAFQLQPIPAAIRHPLTVRYGDVAELVGTDSASIRVRPGQVARLTLYWRVSGPVGSNLHILIRSVGSPTVNRESLPGAGKLFATEWRPGMAWAETYVLPIPADARPGTYPVTVLLESPDSGALLSVRDLSGQPIEPVVGQITIVP
jgi:Dolichyl-phosphate-mannose-protein mannosyltransferase